jgi:hypothetical protein
MSKTHDGPVQCFFWKFTLISEQSIVFLPGFQKGMHQGYQASAGKGQGAVLAKKGQFATYKEKLEKWTEFHYF